MNRGKKATFFDLEKTKGKKGKKGGKKNLRICFLKKEGRILEKETGNGIWKKREHTCMRKKKKTGAQEGGGGRGGRG